MTMDAHAIRVLQPVITCARSVLADMEPDDVPAVLRRIARSSARTLPPPYARSLLRELVDNEAFRDSVAEDYEAGDGADPDLVAFLRDPEAGMDIVNGLAQTSRGTDESAALGAAQVTIAALEDQLAQSKKRMVELREQHNQDVQAVRSSVSEGKARADARIYTLEKQLELRQEEIGALTDRVQHLTRELDESKIRRASITARQRRREDAPVADTGQRSDASPSDPMDLARWLDTMERQMRPFRARRPGQSSGSGHIPLAIDKGVSPDSGDAVASMILQQPRRFILDGYNIAGELDATEFSTRRARDDVIGRAETLARKANTEVLVVFDGPDDDGRPGFRSSDGVVVQFSRGNKADDVIADLVRTDPQGTVVVTNDRELRSRCTVEGCVPLWSTAFLEWLQPNG